MNQVPLPHFLTVPRVSNKYSLRIVTDQVLKPGEPITSDTATKWNMEKNRWEHITYEFVPEEIIEERSARGDWTNWKTHPTYYEIRCGKEQNKTVVLL